MELVEIEISNKGKKGITGKYVDVSMEDDEHEKYHGREHNHIHNHHHEREAEMQNNTHEEIQYESLKEIAQKNDIPLKELYKLEELK